jgi:MFS transporter, MHS family, shikimate and dehydroshikimate transport protein
MANQSVPRLGVLDRPAAETTSIRHVALASFIGTAVEWYDFFVYGTAAALIFPKLFFPQFSAFAGTLASFATFGVGLVARPVGGLVFGHFGDRVGRKSMLVMTLLLGGSATLAVGLLPTFNDIGIFAPTLLVVLRFVQGFAVGGEWGGAMLMVVEHASEERRNFYASWPQFGVPVGLMISTAVFAVSSSMSNEHFIAWGWRIPFLLSVVLIAIGLFIRMRVVESPAFERIKQRKAQSKLPLLELLRGYPVAVILGAGAGLINVTGFYVVTTFVLSYAPERFGIARNAALIGVLVAGAGEFVGILVFARVADRTGTRAVAVWSAASLVLLSYPFFWLIDTGRVMLICVAMGAYMCGIGALYGITGILLAELFETKVRYSGTSLAYQMAGLLGGAPAPLISAALVHWAGGASWPVATYLGASAFISFIAVCLVLKKDAVAIIPDAISAEVAI